MAGSLLILNLTVVPGDNKELNIMKRRSIGRILLIALLALVLAGLYACNCAGPIDDPDDPTNGPNSNGQNELPDLPAVEIPPTSLISPDELHTLITTEPFVIYDTRSYLEYSEGSVPGAYTLPFRFVERRQAEISRNRVVVFVAVDEHTLKQLYGLLIGLGFDPTNIRMLNGGMTAWIAAGYKVELHDIPDC